MDRKASRAIGKTVFEAEHWGAGGEVSIGHLDLELHLDLNLDADLDSWTLYARTHTS